MGSNRGIEGYPFGLYVEKIVDVKYQFVITILLVFDKSTVILDNELILNETFFSYLGRCIDFYFKTVLEFHLKKVFIVF